jgi:hypothetical protein
MVRADRGDVHDHLGLAQSVMEAIMTLGLCYWILMIVWAVFGLVIHFGYAAGYGVAGNTLLLFVLFVLLGWQTFGPPLHR